MAGKPLRARIGRTPIWIGVAVIAALSILASLAVDLGLATEPTPTPAAMRQMPAGSVTQVVIESYIPPPGGIAATGLDRARVRLRQDVLVHTLPSPESPRPLVSALGKGQIADVVDRQSGWVHIAFGPLSGWTREEYVEDAR